MAQSGLAQIQLENRVIVAHGVIMGLTFGMLFPLGATIMHAFKFKGFLWFHAGWQIFTYILALAGFGMGVWTAVVTDQVSNVARCLVRVKANIISNSWLFSTAIQSSVSLSSGSCSSTLSLAGLHIQSVKTRAAP